MLGVVSGIHPRILINRSMISKLQDFQPICQPPRTLYFPKVSAAGHFGVVCSPCLPLCTFIPRTFIVLLIICTKILIPERTNGLHCDFPSTLYMITSLTNAIYKFPGRRVVDLNLWDNSTQISAFNLRACLPCYFPFFTAGLIVTRSLQETAAAPDKGMQQTRVTVSLHLRDVSVRPDRYVSGPVVECSATCFSAWGHC